MIQLLIFHHRERPWWGYHIRPAYKKGGIIEVYAKHAKIDRVSRWSYLKNITVEDILYVHGIQYRKRRILLNKLPKADRKELRRTGKVVIKEDVFYQSLEGEK